uniref:Uncharacterized protein n=1 Tax=Meloidogyne javanica TaxID=6303 RepID=A0A915M1C6_MELJA
MSSSNSSETDRLSEWTPTGYCECSVDFYEVWKIDWKSHAKKSGVRIVTSYRHSACATHIHDEAVPDDTKVGAKHDAVRLFIYCRNCGRNMSLVCELSNSGKRMRWGYYGYYVDQIESQEFKPRLSYNMIKEVYDEMFQNYEEYKDREWAKDFYYTVNKLQFVIT